MEKKYLYVGKNYRILLFYNFALIYEGDTKMGRATV